MSTSNNPFREHMHEMSELPHDLPNDLPLPELNAFEHGRRMAEMMDRPATPPPFPHDLPNRVYKQPRTWWQWVLLTTIILGLLATIITLAILLSNATVSNATLQLHLQEADLAASLSIMAALPSLTKNLTLTLTPTPTTATRNITATLITTLLITPTPTCRPDTPLFLANNICAMVNACNSTSGFAHNRSADCENFCHLNPICSEQWDNAAHRLEMAPQLVGCCGYCGCFDWNRKYVTVKLWPSNPTATGG